jgi:hypothetical protein
MDSDPFRRRNSELNRTVESNLLDFNEDRFIEDTKVALQSFGGGGSIKEETNSTPSSGSLSNKHAKNHDRRRGSEAMIEGFLHEMMMGTKENS